MTTYSLRPNVAVEPGVQGWYAWCQRRLKLTPLFRPNFDPLAGC